MCPVTLRETVLSRFNPMGEPAGHQTVAVTTINAWNRLAIAARTEPGHHKPTADGSAPAHPAS